MFNLPDSINCNVGVLGLGYVGLPLALQIAKTEKCYKTKIILCRKVIGFDISEERINELKNFNDKTGEYTKELLQNIPRITYTNNIKDLIECEVFIITVPTPIDDSKKPDLSFLRDASKIVAECISNKSRKKIAPIIIYESTVYPGVTEDYCIPLIEQNSGLEANKDFYYGYSPERINPGDQIRTINNITKLTSGSDINSAEWIDKFYSSIISAGTYLTKTIKIAEAAKIIENTQRDINVALVNPALCYMEVKDHGLVPWRNGKVYLINILKKHRVQNNSNSSRIHMIAQAHIGNKRDKFNELLDRSLKKNGIRI